MDTQLSTRPNTRLSTRFDTHMTFFCEKGLVILDLDGTLIDTAIEDKYYGNMRLFCNAPLDVTLSAAKYRNMTGTRQFMYMRPYLGEFLDFLGSHFEHMAIWTNATHEWLSIFIDNACPEYKERFLFTRARDTCASPLVYTRESDSVCRVKNLEWVFENYGSAVERNRTVIVEDDVSNILQAHLSHAIIVPRFRVDCVYTDTTLLMLKTYIKQCLKKTQELGVTDKRLWVQEISRLLE
jgi:hypothetical protein